MPLWVVQKSLENTPGSNFLLKEIVEMEKSCKYCGSIHDEGHICKSMHVKRKKIDDVVRFRNSAVWHRKRQQIKKRDCYLCQVCIRELYGTHRKYNYEGLQVHHAVPVNSSEELRLDSSNLITLCSKHHAMCDKGEIPYEEVKQIILEQEQKGRCNYVC